MKKQLNVKTTNKNIQNLLLDYINLPLHSIFFKCNHDTVKTNFNISHIDVLFIMNILIYQMV